MLAGRFPVLMFSFIMRTLVSFWWERETQGGGLTQSKKFVFIKRFFFFNLAMLWLTIDSSVLFCFVFFLNTTRKFVKNISYWYRRRRWEEDEATGNSSSQCAGEKKKRERIFQQATANSVWQMVVPYKVLVGSKHCYLCYCCQEWHPRQVFHENVRMQGTGWWGRFITDWCV